MNLELYLERIKLKKTTLNEDFLFHLQTSQLTHIVFENIDCFLKKPIDLSIQALENKLLQSKRGGYCFELNGLLEYALKDLGFVCRPILSRVMYRGTGVNAKTHIFLLVTIGKKNFIVDAGFGGPGLFSPMPFEIDRIDAQKNGEFKIVTDPEFHYVLKKKNTDGLWSNVFAFNLDTVYPPDIEMSNFYTSTLPTSHFRHNLILALFKEDHRITLLNKTFNKIFHHGKIESTEIAGDSELFQILTEQFQLPITIEEAHALIL